MQVLRVKPMPSRTCAAAHILPSPPSPPPVLPSAAPQQAPRPPTYWFNMRRWRMKSQPTPPGARPGVAIHSRGGLVGMWGIMTVGVLRRTTPGMKGTPGVPQKTLGSCPRVKPGVTLAVQGRATVLVSGTLRHGSMPLMPTFGLIGDIRLTSHLSLPPPLPRMLQVRGTAPLRPGHRSPPTKSGTAPLLRPSPPGLTTATMSVMTVDGMAV